MFRNFNDLTCESWSEINDCYDRYLNIHLTTEYKTTELINKLQFYRKKKQLRRKDLRRLLAKSHKIKNSNQKAKKAADHNLERELQYICNIIGI